MSENNWLTELVDELEDDAEYLTELQILHFTKLVVDKMQELKISRVELANRLDVSKAFVTKLLNGNPNMTIKTMVTILNAIGCRLNLGVYPKGFEVPRKAMYLYTNKNYEAYQRSKSEENEVHYDCAA
jgi:transcriptional regulator with XRE-family HTH domain